MSGMMRYYLSRTLIAAVFGLFFYMSGVPWWMALLTSARIIALFLWLPSSGRYVVKPEAGATPLRRDERSQQISNRAGSIAFAVVMIVTGMLLVFFGVIQPGDMPVHWLALVVALGALSYLTADIWLRRK